MTRNPTARLLGVVNSIYESALEPESWPKTLHAISGLLSSSASALFVMDRATGTLPIAAFDPHGPADAAMDYGHFSAIDDLRQFARRQPVGDVLDTAAFPRDLLRRSACYQDFYRRWGLAQFVGSLVFDDGEQEASLVIYRGDNRAAYSEGEIATVARLLPHVCRSLEIWNRMKHIASVTETVAQGVTAESRGTIVIGRGARVLWIDERAEEIVRAADGIRVVAGKLVLEDRQSAGMLEPFCDGAVVTALGPIEPLEIEVRRASGRSPLHILARRVGRGERVVLLVSDREDNVTAPDERLKAQHGLTRAEATMLVALATGQTVQEFAAERGISQATARTHLKHLMRKTDTHRQADLIRLVLLEPRTRYEA